jgi:hypothetical protein
MYFLSQLKLELTVLPSEEKTISLELEYEITDATFSKKQKASRTCSSCHRSCTFLSHSGSGWL